MDELPNSCSIVHPRVLCVVCSKHLMAALDKHGHLFTSAEHREYSVPIIRWLGKCPHAKLCDGPRHYSNRSSEMHCKPTSRIGAVAGSWARRNFTNAEVP